MKKQQYYDLIDVLNKMNLNLEKINQKLEDDVELKSKLIESVDSFTYSLKNIEQFVEILGKTNEHMSNLHKISDGISKVYLQDEQKNELLKETLNEIK